MIIHSVRTAGFRNLKPDRIELSSQVNAFIGLNAQGKTNILEAVSVLSNGRSFRSARLPEMVCAEADNAAVEGRILRGDREDTLKLYMSRTARQFFVNDRRVSDLREFLGRFSYVVFSAESMGIIDGEPGARRDFLDHGCFSLNPLYLLTLRNFRKVLKSRNAVLKSDPGNRALIETWNEPLSRYSAEIARARQDYIHRIGPEAAKIHRRVTGGQEELAISYASTWFDVETMAESSLDELKGWLDERLKRDMELDIRRGCTHAGSHRDDLMITVNDRDMRCFGSRGQKRTAVVSLKLAEIHVFNNVMNDYPVLLLDDIASEFDEKRQKELIRAVPEDIQVIISHTARFHEMFDRSIRYFDVSDGKAVPMPH